MKRLIATKEIRSVVNRSIYCEMYEEVILHVFQTINYGHLAMFTRKATGEKFFAHANLFKYMDTTAIMHEQSKDKKKAKSTPVKKFEKLDLNDQLELFL